MSQPWGDRQGEFSSPGQTPGQMSGQMSEQAPGQIAGQAPWTGTPSSAAVRPYAAQPYPAQPYPAQPYSPVAIADGNLVSAGGRLGAFLLDGLLIVVTLGIGYLIWALITWSDGQTPGKKLLGHVVADAQTGVPLDWGRMALRQFVIQGLLGGLLSGISLSIYFWVDAFMVFGERQRTLHDRMANSIVRHV